MRDLLCNFGIAGFDAQEKTGLVVKSFFVTEHHDFVADLDLGAIGFERDEANGRRSGFSELLFRFVTDVRARAEFDLLGGEFHREGQAGGKTAFLTVGLREHFVDLDSG